MKIGYVHVGPPQHGVTRYGRLLAGEARRHPALTVLEADVGLTDDPRTDVRRVAAAARRLGQVDIVHVQYNNQLAGSVWGAGWRQWLYLRVFAAVCSKPLVATVHDVYRRPPSNGGPAARRMRAAIDPPAATLRWLQGHARSVFVCSNEERARLAPVDPNVHVIPMFVEPRSLNHTRDEARAALGLTGKRVVTLLGFVHGRKGHRLLIEALTYLPRDFMVVFAGGAVKPDSTVISDLLTLAEARDVGERLRVTGYLSEDRLNQYLAATDLAVCPFKDVSASASLSTWLSAGRRILASDLPLISEYNAMEPGAIRTFSQHTPEALASGILAAFETEGEADSQAIGRLRDRLLLPSMLNRFVDAYAEALDGKSR